MMEMPKITECDAEECAYNMNKMCHAMAITVGAGVDHRCDTFLPLPSKGGVADMTGSVGACKVRGCKHNKNLECGASQVRIGHEGDEVDCLTFESR